MTFTIIINTFTTMVSIQVRILPMAAVTIAISLSPPFFFSLFPSPQSAPIACFSWLHHAPKKKNLMFFTASEFLHVAKLQDGSSSLEEEGSQNAGAADSEGDSKVRCPPPPSFFHLSLCCFVFPPHLSHFLLTPLTPLCLLPLFVPPPPLPLLLSLSRDRKLTAQ
jgi:hypothetical protein